MAIILHPCKIIIYQLAVDGTIPPYSMLGILISQFCSLFSSIQIQDLCYANANRNDLMANANKTKSKKQKL